MVEKGGNGEECLEDHYLYINIMIGHKLLWFRDHLTEGKEVYTTSEVIDLIKE
jgi:hypothetical protein